MILPPATLGLLGGGQLGRYFTLSARLMGYRVWVLDPDPMSPAGQLADRHLCAAYTEESALAELAAGVAVVTCEFENVPARGAEWLAERVLLRPSPHVLAIAQDRVAEKRFLEQAGVPVAPWTLIDSPDAAVNLQVPWAFPGRLKTARWGYDGKGQARVSASGSVVRVYRELAADVCVLEQQMDLEREISVILARDVEGRCRCFPVAENLHKAGILHLTRVPARISPALQRQAEAVAQHIAEALDYCGVLTVEFFVSPEQELYVNEIAPRPHNSGHYSLDAVSLSQFAQQVRAVCGLPLAPADLLVPVAMVNLLGDLWPSADGMPDFSGVLSQARARLHLYGKPQARVGRKMGHITVLASPDAVDAAQAVHRAETLWQALANCPDRLGAAN